MKKITFLKIILLVGGLLFFTNTQTAHAEGSLGKCTCKGPMVTMILIAETHNYSTFSKDLDTPATFPKVNINDCGKDYTQFSSSDDKIVYKNCTFTPDIVKETNLADDFHIKAPVLNLNWPGLNFSQLKDIVYQDDGGNRYLKLPWLAEFIKAVYNFALGIASIVAVVMIIIEGVKIILSGTALAEGDTPAAHYKNIGRILIGLVLAWSSYLILYTINPKLTQPMILQTAYIDKVDMPEDLNVPTQTADGSEITIGATDEKGWSALPSSNLLKNTQGKKARVELINALVAVSQEYGKPISVNSAARTLADQYAVMISECKCPPVKSLTPGKKYTVDDWKKICSIIVNTGTCNASYKSISYENGVFHGPTGAGHMAGNAVDLSGNGTSNIECKTIPDDQSLARDSDGVIKSKGKSAGWCIPKSQQDLIKIMLKHGFCVGLKNGSSLREPWHFEYMGPDATVKQQSPFCTNDLNDANIKKLKYVVN